MSLVVRTEVWNTRKGQVAKAVLRDEAGKVVSATNQTASVPLSSLVVGKR